MRLYIGNLSYQATEDAIRELFSEYGDVRDVSIVLDRDTGRPRGFAFVTIDDDDQARQAIEKINGTTFMERNLVVSEAKTRPGGG